MPPQSEQNTFVGYIVGSWPRLSHTYVLCEILALQRQGVKLRIFSTKNTDAESPHADRAQVKCSVVCLSLRKHWGAALFANLRLAMKLPGRFCQTLLLAISFRNWRTIRRFFQACYLADMLMQEPVAHLHAHRATAPTLLAMFTRQLIGIPYTFTAHEKDIYVGTQPKLLRAQMQRAEAVVTISEYNRGYLSNQLDSRPNGKVRCIYKGVDLAQFKPSWPRAADSRSPTILSVGRLIEKKGFSGLISMAHILRQRGHGFHLEIIGAGPLEAVLQDKVRRLRLEHLVNFLGPQPHEIVRLAFQRATLFALSCVITGDGDRDGIPTVLLEAMASGVPVVSTRVSGIPELIRSGCNGLLVEPDNPLLLADAVEALMTDSKLRDRLARAARDTVESRFAIDRNCRELLALFGTREEEYKQPTQDLLLQW